MITSTQNRPTTGKLLALALLLAALTSLMLAAKPSHASTTFTVTNTNDSGAGSLRHAITDANATAGTDVINFNIDGSGVHTIAPQSPLPDITEAVSINGYTQPGAHPNQKAVGSDAVLKIELNAAGVPDGEGLVIKASNSTIKGLVVNRSSNSGILIIGSGATGNRVAGNYLGTDASGTQDLGNGSRGVGIYNGENNTVGGTTAGARNVISGNNGEGIVISGNDASGNKVKGNYIGTDKIGTADLGNGDQGVNINTAPNNTVGGTTTAERNVISGNDDSGVYISGDGATGNRVLQNVISRNDDTGVAIFDDGATGNRILSNSIFANGLLGIDLRADGHTANDSGDTDTGPNNLQNKPVLSSARKGASGTTTVRGTLNSTPDKTFNVQFFSNPEGTDEGKTLLGSKSVSTDGSGNVSFSFSTTKAIRLGQNITATATGPGGNTSEFSAPRKVVAQ